MPLLDFYTLPDFEATLGIWEIHENIFFFSDRLELFPEEFKEIESLKERKLLEWYCSRYLLHIMSNREIRGACLKDEFGKPYLKNSDYHISMSHSHEFTAVIASRNRVGIDIQYKVEKIYRIAGRVLSDKEMEDLQKIYSLDALHVYWGAKEAMYKIYGRKEIEFKKELIVDAFTVEDNRVITTGRIIKESIKIECCIKAQILREYVLVYAWEKV
jgi:4'-phosphopantetheinyl transferase